MNTEPTQLELFDNAPEPELNLYLVDTFVSYRMRYAVKAKELSHAYDEVTMATSGNPADTFVEITQKCLGEVVVDGREISLAEYDALLTDLETDKDEISSYWMGHELIRTIDYGKN